MKSNLAWFIVFLVMGCRPAVAPVAADALDSAPASVTDPTAATLGASALSAAAAAATASPAAAPVTRTSSNSSAPSSSSSSPSPASPSEPSPSAVSDSTSNSGDTFQWLNDKDTPTCTKGKVTVAKPLRVGEPGDDLALCHQRKEGNSASGENIPIGTTLTIIKEGTFDVPYVKAAFFTDSSNTKTRTCYVDRLMIQCNMTATKTAGVVAQAQANGTALAKFVVKPRDPAYSNYAFCYRDGSKVATFKAGDFVYASTREERNPGGGQRDERARKARPDGKGVDDKGNPIFIDESTACFVENKNIQCAEDDKNKCFNDAKDMITYGQYNLKIAPAGAAQAKDQYGNPAARMAIVPNIPDEYQYCFDVVKRDKVYDYKGKNESMILTGKTVEIQTMGGAFGQTRELARYVGSAPPPDATSSCYIPDKNLRCIEFDKNNCYQ